MSFEFDPKKSHTNKEKHGIDFQEAQRLWEDQNRIIYPTNMIIDEERFLMIALYNQKHWSAIYTIRNENIRIISVRRARKEEVTLYES